MKKRIELAIFDNFNSITADNLNKNIGSLYVRVTPLSLSHVRSTLSDSYTTRLLVIYDTEKIFYYVYGKKKKNQGVFNLKCKNTVLNNTSNFIDTFILTSSNVGSHILSDNDFINSRAIFLNRIIHDENI